MTAKLVLEFSAEVLDALRKAGHLHIQLTARSASGAASAPRAGSLPARILAWAEKRKKSFGVADIERRMILMALKQCNGNQARAAQRLRIPRTTLRDKMARYDIPAS